MLKHRIHSTPITFGHPCPVSDLFGVAGRELLDQIAIPQPWRGSVDASLQLIEDLERQIDDINRGVMLALLLPRRKQQRLGLSATALGSLTGFR
jgi:hypothetical protein